MLKCMLKLILRYLINALFINPANLKRLILMPNNIIIQIRTFHINIALS